MAKIWSKVSIPPSSVAASTLTGKRRPDEGFATATRLPWRSVYAACHWYWQRASDSQNELLKRELMSNYDRKYAALAPVVRQGRVDLGVRTGRGLSTARGTAEAKAPEMPVYLGTR
jgi:hypothetical protein